MLITEEGIDAIINPSKRSPLIPDNFEIVELGIGESFIEKLKKYSHKKLSKIKPTFGIEDSNKPTLGKTIARKIRTLNNLVDLIIDKFVS